MSFICGGGTGEKGDVMKARAMKEQIIKSRKKRRPVFFFFFFFFFAFDVAFSLHPIFPSLKWAEGGRGGRRRRRR